MPRNIEIKARAADRSVLRVIAERLGARFAGSERQVDRYYELDGARRVKLRTVAGARTEQIRYERPEARGIRVSDYEVLPVRDEPTGRCLVPPGKPLVTVRKEREIYLLDNVRIHLDRVEELGDFLELEAVVDEDHDEEICHRRTEELLEAFGLGEGALLRASYSDLVLEKARGEGKDAGSGKNARSP